MKLYRIYISTGNLSDVGLDTYYVTAESFVEAIKLFEAQPIAMVELMGWTENTPNVFLTT